MKYFKFTVKPAGSDTCYQEVFKYEKIKDYFEVANDCNFWGEVYCEDYEYLATGDIPEEDVEAIEDALEKYWDNCMWRWDEITETEYNNLKGAWSL